MMDEDKERIRERAIEVCRCMDGWRLDGRDDLYGTVLLSDGGRGLFFHPIWSSADRMEISGYYGGLGQFLPYDREKTKITVSMAKAPERVARDIEKRLLPAYERMLAKAIESKERHDRYEREKKDVLESVRDAIGGDAHIIQDDRVISYRPFHCDAEHRSGHDVQLKLTLPLKKAIRVLRMLGRRPEIKL